MMTSIDLQILFRVTERICGHGLAMSGARSDYRRRCGYYDHNDWQTMYDIECVRIGDKRTPAERMRACPIHYNQGNTMATYKHVPVYSLEYRAPKHKAWYSLSVTAHVPFSHAELSKYKQMLAERTTAERGQAVFADQIRLRTMCDGKELKIS